MSLDGSEEDGEDGAADAAGTLLGSTFVLCDACPSETSCTGSALLLKPNMYHRPPTAMRTSTATTMRRGEGAEGSEGLFAVLAEGRIGRLPDGGGTPRGGDGRSRTEGKTGGEIS